MLSTELGQNLFDLDQFVYAKLTSVVAKNA